MQLKHPLTELKAPIGTTIVYQIRHLMGLRFLNIKTNFNVIEHISFAKRIEYIPGIVGLKSVQIDTKITGSYLFNETSPGVAEFKRVSRNAKASGSYFFALSKDYDLKTVTEGIKHEFETYFIDFK